MKSGRLIPPKMTEAISTEFRGTLSGYPLCADRFTKGEVRRRPTDEAVTKRHIQVNNNRRLDFFAFDIDQPGAVLAY